MGARRGDGGQLTARAGRVRRPAYMDRVGALVTSNSSRGEFADGVVDLSPLGGLHEPPELGLHRCTAVDPASEALEELLTRPGLVVSR